MTNINRDKKGYENSKKIFGNVVSPGNDILMNYMFL